MHFWLLSSEIRTRMMTRTVRFLLVITVVSLPEPVNAAKILLIPANVNSHLIYFGRLGGALSDLGHRVHLLAASNAKLPNFISADALNFNVETYPVEGEVPYASSPAMSDAFMQVAMSKSFFEMVSIVYVQAKLGMKAFDDDSVALLENKDLMQRVADAHFDFAVVDPSSLLSYALPYSLGIRYASFAISFCPLVYRVPRLPSMFSSLGYSDEMTFRQRLTSFAYESFMHVLFQNSPAELIQKYIPDDPDIDSLDLMQRSALWLYLEDLSVGYPRPNMPNTVSVGDVSAHPAHPLPDDLRRDVDESPHGVVVVSFGSFFDFVPEEVARKFCTAFRSIRYDVIWKLKTAEFCTNASNVRLMDWLPQNDLLANPNVKLLITHAGFNSLVESVYNAKPVIAFPIAVDQPANAMAAQSRGYGIRMNIASFTAEELIQNIDKVLADPSYSANARLSSAILRDKPETPAKRVSFLMEHVIKYGDKHLRTGAYGLSTAQFIMFDIFAFITAVLALLLVVFALICRCTRWICDTACLKRFKAKNE